MNKYGLTQRDIQTLFGIFGKFKEVKSVYIYGSRAKGTYKFGSDIDLAIMNEGVSDRTINDIIEEMQESDLPYFVDITNFATLNHKELAEQIQKMGIPFYSCNIN